MNNLTIQNSDFSTINDDQYLKKIVTHVYEKQAEIREPILYKSSPFWIPHEVYSRSGLFKKCCIDCTPNSTITYDAKNKNHLFVNILRTRRKYQVKQKNLFKQLNPKLFNLFDCELKLNLKSYGEKILLNKNITKLLSEFNQSKALEKKILEPYEIEIINQKILRTVSQIESNIQSERSIKVTLITIKSIFRLIFDKILCYQLHLGALNAAQNKHLPIIYVLKSDSLMDRLLIQMTLFINKLGLANVLWSLSENALDSGFFQNKFINYLLGLLNVRMINKTMCLNTKMVSDQFGLNQRVENLDSISYQKIITAYIMEELKNENSVMIKNDSIGLQDIVDGIEKELIHDVLIVPVSVNYEKLLFREFELKNCRKVFFKWIKTIFKGGLLGRTNGQIRVNFGQPFSLKEFTINQREKNFFKKNPAEQNLIKHLNFDISQTESIMCTNIVAFILTTYYPTGCNSTQLSSKILEIKNNLTFSYQIGFNYNKIQDVILYTTDLLSNLIEYNSSLSGNNSLIRPRDNKSILELFHHGKLLTEIFFLKSIIAKSVSQLVKYDLHFINFERRNSYFEINENDLIHKCFELISVFQYEFKMFKKPCETIFSRLNKNICDLVNMDILTDLKSKQNEAKYMRLNKSFKHQYDDDWNSEEDEDFFTTQKEKFDSTQEDLDPDQEEISNWKSFKNPRIYKVNRDHISKLMLFARIIDPFIEAYLRCIETIKSLSTEKIFHEDEIFKLIEEENQKQYLNGKVKSIISTDNSLGRSAINFCLNVKIFDKIEKKIGNQLQNGQMFTFNKQSEIAIAKYRAILRSF